MRKNVFLAVIFFIVFVSYSSFGIDCELFGRNYVLTEASEYESNFVSLNLGEKIEKIYYNKNAILVINDELLIDDWNLKRNIMNTIWENGLYSAERKDINEILRSVKKRISERWADDPDYPYHPGADDEVSHEEAQKYIEDLYRFIEEDYREIRSLHREIDDLQSQMDPTGEDFLLNLELEAEIVEKEEQIAGLMDDIRDLEIAIEHYQNNY